MATKYLRKIVLEELKKVLKEIEDDTTQDADASYNVDIRGDKSGPDLGPCTQPGDPGCRDSSNVSSKKSLSPKTIAIINLQKQLRKLGATQAYKGNVIPLRTDGIVGNATIASISDALFGETYEWTIDDLKSVSKIKLLTNYLSKMSKEQYATNTQKHDQDMASQEQAGAAAPKNPLEGPGGKVEKPIQVQVGPTPEEIERAKREAEEKRKAEREVYPRVPGAPGSQQESLIRKEINKLLRQL